jgi:hypothetical protein
VLAVLAAASACGGHDAAPATGSRGVGPQGSHGQFVVECGLSHTASDDPIVRPGEPGASHLHRFFGNRDVDAGSTYESLQGAATSCDQPRDTASYWAPALLDGDGRLIESIRAVAYYRGGAGIAPTSVVAYPPALKMLAGDPHATAEQSIDVVAWSCGAGRPRTATPPQCPPDSALGLNVTFPDCWDGRNLDSADHRTHTARSTGGRCPSSHPVPIPELLLVVEYPPLDPHRLSLSSGGVLSGHADFWNVWDQAKLETEVAGCLNRDVVCGVSDR